MDNDTTTDDDISGKRNKIPTPSPSLHQATKQTVSDSNSEDENDNDDSETDLNTPKRNKVADDNDNKKVHKKVLDDGNAPKTTVLPSTRPSKPLGLGLKNSLNLLEPTGTTQGASHSVKSQFSPTVAPQVTLRPEEKPTFVNVSKNAKKDEVSLEVTDKPANEKTAVLTPTQAVTQSQRKLQCLHMFYNNCC